MDYRTETIARRFKNALPHLSVAGVEEIISIKYRADCVNGMDYARLIDDLGHRTAELEIAPMDRQFGEQAWLVKDARQGSIILVEHETGLEILSAAASVASLIAIVPLIGSAWSRLRDRFSRRDDSSVEIRQLDNAGNLIEREARSVEVYILNISLQEQAGLKESILELEQEVKRLKAPTKKKKALKRKRRDKKGRA